MRGLRGRHKLLVMCPPWRRSSSRLCTLQREAMCRAPTNFNCTRWATLFPFRLATSGCRRRSH